MAGKKGKEKNKNKEVKEMAFDLNSCPGYVKELNEEAQAKWLEVANACIAAGDSKEFAESRAMTAVKEGWEKDDKGEWVKKVPATGSPFMGGMFALDDPTHEMKGVEIFAAGKWNGDDYTEADLDEMVKNFDAGIVKNVPLKVGHDGKQQVAGQPAVGILQRIYKVGKKLLADIGNIPKVVAELINKKAYHGVSSEIAWDADFDGKIYKRLLTGVALLGAEIPAVNKLEELPAIYKAAFSKVATFAVKDGNIEEEVVEPEVKPEGEQPENEPEVKPEAEPKAEPEGEPEAKPEGEPEAKPEEEPKPEETDEVKALKAELKKKEEELAAVKVAEEKVKLNEFVAKLEADSKIVPAQKERILLSLIEADNSIKKEYAIGDQKVSETQRENLMRVYEGLAKLNIYTEMAHAEAHSAGSPEDKSISLAKKYAAEKNKSFKDALVDVYNEHPEWVTEAKLIR